MRKFKNYFIVVLFFVSLNSCSEYNAKKEDTEKEYQLFLKNHERQLNIITKICYDLRIQYVMVDSLKTLIKEDSLKVVVDSIEFIKFNRISDYESSDIKLKIKENKCLDFFLTKPLSSNKKDSAWDVKIIEKSPCF